MLPFNRKLFTLLLLFALVLGNKGLFSQELFPLNEPASDVPKGVFGVRAFDKTYKEVDQFRNLFCLRAMVGAISRLSVYGTVSVSNHHGKNFPEGLASHTHNANGTTTYSTGSFQRGLNNPYIFAGFSLYAKYRFLSFDEENQHFRMSLYGNWSNVNVAHDEAEPNLLDDTKGYGGGFISTFLKNHFAVSLTSGVVIPGAYQGYSPDVNGGPMIPTEVKYGRAVNYNLSFGYLLFPRKYQSYNQGNWNMYLEFMGKAYEQARVSQYGGTVKLPISTPLLMAGNYVDISPGIQYIHKSNLRVDFSVQFPFINKSYSHQYPVYVLGVQRYFYVQKKK